MLINILDANSLPQKVIVPSQEAIVDHSGSIAVTGTAQTLLAANVNRSGWVLQNRGSNPMYVNELGTATTGAGSFAILPGATFPPHGFPVSTGAISILGTAAEVFTVREW